MVGATVGDCEVPFKRSQQFYEVVPRMPAAEFAGSRVSLCIQGRIAEVGRLRIAKTRFKQVDEFAVLRSVHCGVTVERRVNARAAPCRILIATKQSGGHRRGRVGHEGQHPVKLVLQVMEEMDRRHIARWLQGLLEDEVTQFLGRARYHRRDEGERGYRNGYRKPRRLTTRAGTVTVRRPRGARAGATLRERAVAAVRGSRGARNRSTTCCRSCTCTGRRWATSRWRCAGCSGRERRCRRAR